MNKTRTLFLLILTAVVFLSCSFINRPLKRDYFPWELSKINEETFSRNNLNMLQKNGSIEFTNKGPYSYYTGDVTGDKEEEIVIISKDQISLYKADGSFILKKQFEGMDFGNAVIADIDNNTKKDIIIGSAKSKGVNISAYSGLLDLIFNFVDSDIYNGETRVHFYNQNNIYFTSKSPLLTPPKIVGALNTTTETLSWSYFTGPAPLDIAANKDFTHLTISATPKSKNSLLENEKFVSDHSRFRNSIYILDNIGNIQTQISIGPEFIAGNFTKGGISSTTGRIFDLNNDGTDELILAINRISDFFIGKSALEVRSMGGILLNRKEFKQNTELEFSFYTTPKGNQLAVLLKQQGEFIILDKDLKTLYSWKSIEENGEGILQESGDFNGDGLIEHLVTFGNKLYIFNSRLEILYSSAFTTLIKKASFISDKKTNPVLVVLSNKFDLLTIGKEKSGTVSIFTNPPGADIFVNGKKLKEPPLSGILKHLPEREVTFQAQLGENKSREITIDVKRGQCYTLDLIIDNYKEPKEELIQQTNDLSPIEPPKVPLKSWDNLFMVNNFKKLENEILITPKLTDLAGDSSKDFLFRTAKYNIYRIYDLSMNLLSQFQLPGDTYIKYVEKGGLDTDSNSKSDLLVNTKNKEEYSILTSQGKLLKHKVIGIFYDTVLGGILLNNNKLYFTINSGYSQQPRGIIGSDPTKNKISFLAPVAAAPMRLLITQNNILLPSIHTPTNGSEVEYPDGEIAKDSEYYVYMTDLNGNHLPQSFNPNLENNNGQIFYYLTDLNQDGNKEIYLIAQKTNYYKGYSKIFRLDTESGSLSEPLFTTSLNDRVFLHSLLYKDYAPILALYTAKPKILHFLSSEFKELKAYNMDERGGPTNWMFPDMDGDGNSEIFIWNKNGLYIHDLDFNLLRSILVTPEEGELKRIILDDTDNDGKEDIILVSDNYVTFYSY